MAHIVRRLKSLMVVQQHVNLFVLNVTIVGEAVKDQSYSSDLSNLLFSYSVTPVGIVRRESL